VKYYLLSLAITAMVSGQAPDKVDFARDVAPLLRERCISCHGPAQQTNGFRVDQRSSVLRARTNLVPGSSETSRLYLRLIGSAFGQQMPPTGALSEAETEIIRKWIDQGAEWPDALANEVDLPAAPQKATPLMDAVLYGDLSTVKDLLRRGADPNVKNHIGATALMWAMDDVEKSRVLLDHGADPNAQAEDGSTPLLVAAGQTRSVEVIRLLLDRGANPNPPARNAGSTPLARAASLGNAEGIRLLLQHGSKSTGPTAFVTALRAKCRECAELLRPVGVAAPAFRNALTAVLPPGADGDLNAVRQLLELGADPNFKDQKGRTMLMLAASAESNSADSLEMLVKHGATGQEKMPSGSQAAPQLNFQAGNTIESAVRRSIPLLQRTAIRFSEKTRCVSCHHNSLTAMTLDIARKKGFSVDSALARMEVKTVSGSLEEARERMLLGISGGAQLDGLPYTLVGLAAENYPPDRATDAVVRGLKNIQQPDGRWVIAAHRPPLESSEIENTAMSMRALQLYTPKQHRRVYNKSVRSATAWLVKARAVSSEDRAFRLLGMVWGGADKNDVRRGVEELAGEQRNDGGWAQLASLQSDAYATGQALFALREAGMAVKDPLYQRGIRYLLRTQLEDGSWYVKSRSLQVQPYFDSLFPHGDDQWISAAATNWATMALALAK
jgi:ankyrin repeat protein